jgi:hypothetical protein
MNGPCICTTMHTETMEEITDAGNIPHTYTCYPTGQEDTLKPFLLPVNELFHPAIVTICCNLEEKLCP